MEGLLAVIVIAAIAWAIGKGRTKSPKQQKCPSCATWISAEALVCPHCRRGLVAGR